MLVYVKTPASLLANYKHDRKGACFHCFTHRLFFWFMDAQVLYELSGRRTIGRVVK